MAQLSKEKGLYNIDLQGAVKYLYKKKIITKDKEIAQLMGVSTPQVSSYINGRALMSPKFKETFETIFKLKLIDFEAGATNTAEVKENPVESDDPYRAERIKKLEEDQAKYIKKLEDDNERLWDLVKDNQEIIKTNLTLVLATVRTVSARQLGTGVVALKSLERLEKSAGLRPSSLVKEADKEIGQIEREAYAHDSGAAVRS